jgi:hypothetical protein
MLQRKDLEWVIVKEVSILYEFKADLLMCAHIVPANRVSHINSTLQITPYLHTLVMILILVYLKKRSYVHSGTCGTYYHLHCKPYASAGGCSLTIGVLGAINEGVPGTRSRALLLPLLAPLLCCGARLRGICISK